LKRGATNINQEHSQSPKAFQLTQFPLTPAHFRELGCHSIALFPSHLLSFINLTSAGHLLFNEQGDTVLSLCVFHRVTRSRANTNTVHCKKLLYTKVTTSMCISF